MDGAHGRATSGVSRKFAAIFSKRNKELNTENSMRIYDSPCRPPEMGVKKACILGVTPITNEAEIVVFGVVVERAEGFVAFNFK